jgi:prefoldin subunit 5
MAKKKTTVSELQEMIKTVPRLNTLTNEQVQTLKDISSDLADIRRTLDSLKGEENISDIMFEVGKSYYITYECENKLDTLLESFENDCYDCDENY